MLHTLSAALALTGLAGAAACSDTSAPRADSALVAAKAKAAPTLTPQQSGTTNRLQAVSPVNAHVVWASGVGGTFTVTTDGAPPGGPVWSRAARRCSSAMSKG